MGWPDANRSMTWLGTPGSRKEVETLTYRKPILLPV